MKTSIRAILTTAAAASFLGSLNAGEANPATLAKPQADVGPYVLQKKSAFTLPRKAEVTFTPMRVAHRRGGAPFE